MAISSGKLKAMINRLVGQIPIGGIIIWSGAIADIPARYQICDGTNGTPNLTGRFVRHADGTTFTPGNTGGGLIQAANGVPSATETVDNDLTGSTVAVASGTHGHIITVDPDEPLYYALAYIMRIK